MPKTILGAIRWTGTKRYISQELITKFPKEIDVYYENCVGSGAVVARLIQSDIKYNHIVCSDNNVHLIGLWKMIQSEPDYLLRYYIERWTELNSFETEHEKSMYYNTQRALFNREKLPEQFFFLCRTSYLGLVRFNKRGAYNVPFCLGSKGVSPKRVVKLINFWTNLIQPIEFRCCDYREIKPGPDDFVFLDPPHFNTSVMYNGEISKDELFEYCKNLPCKYMLMLNGKSDKVDKTVEVPAELSLTHEYIKMGSGSFRKLHGDNGNVVFESIYTNYRYN